MTGLQKPKPVRIACGHTRWFSIYPNVGERIWCPACESYEEVGNAEANRGRLYDEDFWSEPVHGGFKGGCTVGDCEYLTTAKYANWHYLRDHMQKHVMKEHTNFGSNITIQEVDKNVTTPPF